MTRLLSDIFDNCSLEELDLLLEDYDEEICDEKSLDRIMSMTLGKTGITKSTKRMGRNTKTLILIAACVSMVVAMTVGSFVAEALEYNKAVEYLNDNNISIKGLSREDIKNVYHRIITDSYSYAKNSKVVDRNTYNNSVPGYNIAQNNKSNSMLNANYTLNEENTAETGEFYSFDVKGEKEEWITDEKGYEYYIDSIESSYIVKYVDGSEVWEAEFKEFEIYDYIVTEKGVLIYGTTPFRYDGKGWVMWSAFIDNDGKVIWKKKLDKGFFHNCAVYACENDDGTFLVVSCSDNDISDEINPPEKLVKNKDKDHYMVIYNLDCSGKIVSTTTANMGEYFQIDIVLKSGENYIAELYDLDSNNTNFVKMNRDGEILKSFNLNSETYDYEFIDMVEFNGKLYLSATARSNNYSINKIKEETTSFLLVCDYDSGRPKEFYSAKGSFAGKLFVNNHRELKWSIDSIISAEYSPYTSSYSIAGEKRTKTYTFDKTGVLLYETKSNKIERFTSY